MKPYFYIHAALLLATGILAPILAYPQSSTVEQSIRADKTYEYKLPVTPEHIDNYLYSTYATNSRTVYNLKGFEQDLTPYKIQDIKVNPAGHSYALLVKEGKKLRVHVYSLNSRKKFHHEIKDVKDAQAIGYTADSRLLAVASGNEIHLYDSRSLEPAGVLNSAIAAQSIKASPDGRYVVAVDGNQAEILNVESGNSRATITEQQPIVDLEFNNSGSLIGVVTSDGNVSFFDTADFNRTHSFNLAAEPNSIDFHPDDKYVAVAVDNNKVIFVNATNEIDRFTIDAPRGGISDAIFVQDGKQNVYITYTEPQGLVYKRLVGFAPNYTRLLEDELDRRMLEWSKMKPFETEEEYKLRVNDETRATQRKLFANTIATSLAGDLIARQDVTLGKYDSESGTLIVEMGSLPAVYLTVPMEEVLDFTDASDLEFRNTVYGLTPDDTFEVIYAEIYNNKNGKTYIFDNLDRQDLSFLATDDTFVSLELLQKSSLEDARLQQIKAEVLKEAYTAADISEHTQIDVSADATTDVDAYGKRINNYSINFTYTVDPEFSVKEDFPAGKYLTDQSPAAEAMLSIVKKAFEGDFAEYIKPGKKLVVTITGSADALPIGGKLPYADQYGAFESEPCRIDGRLTPITVDSHTGITTNEQLGFIRAQGVRDYLEKNLPQMMEMNPVCNYNVEVSKEKGGAYRRISVSFLFVDAF